MLYDCRDNVVVLPKGKLAVMQDIEDLLVVDTDNVLLICKKGDERDIRKFLNDVRMKSGEEFI